MNQAPSISPPLTRPALKFHVTWSPILKTLRIAFELLRRLLFRSLTSPLLSEKRHTSFEFGAKVDALGRDLGGLATQIHALLVSNTGFPVSNEPAVSRYKRNPSEPLRSWCLQKL